MLRAVAAAVLGCAVVLLTVAAPGVRGAAAEPVEAPLSTFVSIPDLFNTDVGDVSGLPGWRPGFPNSTNESWEAAAATVIDAVAAENPGFVLAAGDLVGGEWHEDYDRLGIFGHLTGWRARQRAVQRAGDTYYSQWLERFASRGLEVFAAVGDHEIGDNPWRTGSPKTRLVGTFKRVWARHFTLHEDATPRFGSRPVGTPYEHTAYSRRFGSVLVVTLDQFVQSSDGSVGVGMSRGQLRWLDSVLGAANADASVRYTIVQGHVPVLGPVRQQASSGLSMPGGADSALWEVLGRHEVDLYLAGEVHGMTATNADGVEQVAHGGHIGATAESNYLVGHVYADRLELSLKQAPVTGGGTEFLWQMGHARSPAERIVGAFATVGTLTIAATGQETNRTGYFEPYAPAKRVPPPFRLGDARVEEQGGEAAAAVFPVTLPAPATEAMTLRYTTAPATATAGEDFAAASGEVTIPPGQSGAQITVRVADDALDEATETFFLDVTGEVEDDAKRARGFIVDNDALPTLTVSKAAVVEGDKGTTTVMRIPVKLSAPSGRPVAFVWKTEDRKALERSDYTRTRGDHVFLPGETRHTIEVPVHGDTRVETKEAFAIKVRWKANALLAAQYTAAVIINDD